MRDPMHKTVCDRCGQGTWYETEQPCHMARQARCGTCGHGLDKYGPCGGTLRIISRSALNPHFTQAYETQDRVRVRWTDGDEMTGTIGKTSGWRPCYLLMRTANAVSSPWTIGPDDRIVAVKRGAKYIRTAY